MNRIVSIFFMSFLMLLSCCMTDQTCMSEREKQRAGIEIQQALIKWAESFNKKDLDGVMSIYAPNILASYQGRPDLQYKELRHAFAKILNNPETSYRYDLEIDQIEVGANLAVSWLFWHLDEQQGQNVLKRSDERAVDVWKKQPDGTWKIVRFNAYPMIAPSFD